MDVHRQLKIAIERWELIYNQLLDMQLNEKKKNEERERKFESLSDELDAIRKASPTYSPFLTKSPIYYASSLSKFTPIQTARDNQQSAKLGSSAYDYDSKSTSHSSYSSSSSMKTSGLDQNYPTAVQYSQITDKNYPILGQSKKIRPDLEENSLIFRRPESSALKDVKCLDKWFEDLGREDAEWIARNQLKNEQLFKELVRLQKLQWDTGLVEHNRKKQQHIPQTFKCELETQSLCEQEEANFKRKFHDYRIDKYPSTLDHQLQQQQSNYDQQIYGNPAQQQRRQSLDNYQNYQNYQKSQNYQNSQKIN